MGVWFHIINYTKREYIFLGSGEPICGHHLSMAIKLRGWSLDENDISVVGDGEFYEEVAKAKRRFVALHLRGESFLVRDPEYPDETSD